MGSVLPEPPGLDINSVIYRYTVEKETQDHLTVHVQNQYALGDGYIFRETDDWLPGSTSGTEIRKVVGVGSIHRSLWGDGSIETEGDGSVYNASVVYAYTVDPCYDPQFNPSCPGYKPPLHLVPEFEYELYDATQDARNDQYSEGVYDDDEENEETEEERAEREAEEKKDREERLEKALAAANTSAMFAQALALANANSSTGANINSYYNKSLPSKTYNDTVVLSDSQLPENNKGLRNGLAQQLLHRQMVEMQYNN